MTGWTVQELIEAGMTLTAYCRNDHHHAVDLVTLLDRLGPDAPAMATDLLPRLVCSRCGEKAIRITYSPPQARS